MIQPSNNRLDDDPEELELPPFGTRSNDDESWQPEDDSDLEIAQHDEERGLDADLGFTDEPDVTPPDEREEDSWLEPGEPRAGLAGEDEAAEEELDEDGWTDGSEPLAASVEEFADDFALEEDSGSEDDRGLEGFGDDGALPDIDLERLPPLDGASSTAEEDDADAVSNDLIAELNALPDGPFRDDGPAARTGGELLRRRSFDVDLEVLYDAAPSLSWLVAADATGVGWNGALLVAAAGAQPERLFSVDEPVLGLAAFDSNNVLYVALATQDELLCSHDGGRHFEPCIGALPVALDERVQLAWSGGERGPRLWLGTPERGCFVSEDLGASFRKAEGPASALVHCEDGLTRLGDAALPPLLQPGRLERVRALELAMEAAPATGIAWRRADQGWHSGTRVRAPAALVAESDGAVGLYYAARSGERWQLLRSGEPERQDDEALCELPVGLGAPRWISGAYQHGRTTLQLLFERGWVRVVLGASAARRAS